MSTVLKNIETEPLLTGDLNERFYKAVHESPALFYDVVRTGKTLKGLSYEIVLLHGSNVDNTTLDKMSTLQDKVAIYQHPHADNVIDYKSEDEIIAHYINGGLGFGAFAVNGDLIAQIMIAFDPNKSEALIKWLMVDNEHRGSNLSGNLIDLAISISQSAGIKKLSASVRAHNERGMEKFIKLGFESLNSGENDKDGSAHLSLCKELDMAPIIAANSNRSSVKDKKAGL